MEWIPVILKAFWCGCAALGFGILFNTPPRSLGLIWFGGFVAGFIKFVLMQPVFDLGIVSASFAAALAIGFASIPAAHLKHVPPMIFAIPSVIPLVPGSYAYKAMLGLMQLTGIMDDSYYAILSNTVHNGAISFFVILALALGVAVPMHIMRKESVKHLRLRK
jgi:uncharacterized membrane protein YjjB (DUF3815 family)